MTIQYTKYAVCVADLTAIMHTQNALPVLILLSGSIDRRETVKCEPRRVDGIGVVLDGSPEMIANAVTLLRDRFANNELRIWGSKSGNGGWRRITK